MSELDWEDFFEKIQDSRSHGTVADTLSAPITDDGVRAATKKASETLGKDLRMAAPADYERLRANLLREGIEVATGQVEEVMTRVYGVLGLTSVPSRRATSHSEYLLALAGAEAMMDRAQAAYRKEGAAAIVTDGSISLRPGQWVVVEEVCYHWDQWLMVLGLVRGRACAIILADTDSTEVADHALLSRKVREVFAWFDKVIRVVGNHGSEVHRCFESVAKGFVMRAAGLIIPAMDGLALALEGMREATEGSEFLVDELEVILGEVTEVRVGVELYGLGRLGGFPIIEIQASIDKMRTYGTAGTALNEEVDQDLEYAARALLLDGILRSSSQWPAFRDPPRRGTALYSMWQSKMLSVPPLSYPLADWEGVTFQQMFALDMRSDTLETLDDKSCAPPADKLGEGLAGRLSGKDSRSVLEAALAGAGRDPRKTLNAWRGGLSFAEDELIQLAAKGGEQKYKGRLFAMMPYSAREARSIMERGLQTDVQPLLAPATKSWSQQELARTMARLARKGKMGAADFSSWNLRWNWFNTRGVAKVLGEVYAEEGLWESVHEQYSRATVVFPDGRDVGQQGAWDGRASTLEKGSRVWRGHYGGIEGQSQTFWEYCTFALMVLVNREYGGEVTNFGQGDNQVFFLGECSDEDAARYAACLDKVSRECGHEAKRDETEVYGGMVYGKRWYLAGEEIRCVLKHAAAGLGHGEEPAPSIVSRLSVPMTTMASISNHYKNPLVAYRAGLILTDVMTQILQFFRRYAAHPSRRTLWDYALVPSVLGGPAAAPLGAFLWRGHVDPLTTGITSARAVGGLGLAFAYHAASLPITSEPEHILDDPHSIPLDKPASSARAGANDVATVLKGYAKGGLIAGVLGAPKTKVKEALMQVIREGAGVHPVIAHEVFKATHEGVKKRMVARFTMTRTLTKLAAREGVDLVGITALLEEAEWVWIEKVMKERGHLRNTWTLPKETAFETAVYLRGKWGLSDMVGVTSLSPMDGTVVPLGSGNGARIVVTVMAGTRQLGRKFYFGSRTDQRLAKASEKALLDTSAQKDVAALMRMRSQLMDHAGIRSVIGSVVFQRTGRTAEEIESYYPRVFGGSAAHRGDVHDRTKFDLSCSPFTPSRTFISTERLGLGKVDKPIAVQEGMLFCSAVASIRESMNLDGGIELEWNHSSIPEIVETMVGGEELELDLQPSANTILTVGDITIQCVLGESLVGLGTWASLPLDLVEARLTGFLCSPARASAADVGAAQFARDRFDKAEVAGVPASTLIKAAVRATIIAGTVARVAIGRDFDGQLPMMGSYLPVAKEVVAQFFQHFHGSYEGKDWLDDIGAMTGVGPQGRDEQEHAMASEIAYRAVTTLLQPPVENSVPWVVALPSQGVERQMAVRAALMAGIIFDTRGPKFGSREVRQRIAAVRSYTEEDLPRLARMRSGLGVAARRLLGKRGIRVCKGTTLELLRSLRSEYAPAKAVELVGPRVVTEVLRVKGGSGAPVEAKDSDWVGEADLEYTATRHYRLSGTVGGIACAEAYDCIPPGKGTALCVGFGKGGSAVALIAAGYEVVGLDLPQVIHDEGSSASEYAPPEVERAGVKGHFSLAKEVWQGGRWEDVGAAAIRRIGPDLVYLGIERGGGETPITDLQPILDAGVSTIVIQRAYGRRETLADIVGAMSLLGRTKVFAPAVLSDQSFAAHIETIVDRTPSVLRRFSVPPEIDWVARVGDPSMTPVGGAGIRDITRAVFGARTGTGPVSLIEARNLIKERLDLAEVKTRTYLPRSLLEDGRDRLAIATAIINHSWTDIDVAAAIEAMPERLRNKGAKAIGKICRIIRTEGKNAMMIRG